MLAVLVLLAAVWVATTGELTLANLAFGAALGFAAITLGGGRVAFSVRKLARLPQAVALLFFFLKELVVANLRVAALVLHPRPNLRPGIVAVPLDLEEDWEITLLANMITLTPGSMSVDLAADRRTLYVHYLSAESADAVRRDIKEGFERRVRRLTR